MAEDLAVRFSHLLRDCSVGAIVRGPGSVMVVPDISVWGGPGDDPWQREIRYVDQVRQVLGIDQALCRPPLPRTMHGTSTGWIGTWRFPTWMRCLDCGLLHHEPWRDIDRGSDRCWGATRSQRSRSSQDLNPCGGRLEQIPWVLVHEDGYLADVPWHDIAHVGRKSREDCARDWKEPYLRFRTGPGIREINCVRCKSGHELVSRFPYPSQTWQQPWFQEPPSAPVETPARVMEINDVRVHTPWTRTALVIPPESRIRHGTVIDRLYGSTRHRESIRDARNELARRAAMNMIADEYGCERAEIEDALVEIESGYPLYGKPVTGTDLHGGEYQALTEPIPSLKEDEDFVTEHHTAAWKALGDRLATGIAPSKKPAKNTATADLASRAIAAVSRLVAVHRLKEIMVFMGFRRAGGRQLVPPDVIGKSDWLPAIELYGEGLFFTLDEQLVQQWEQNPALESRTDAFVQRYFSSDVQTGPPRPVVSPENSHAGEERTGGVSPDTADCEFEVSSRFMLCHTLAHLLIRQLEASAGYPAASLKERIYCSTGRNRGKTPMAGILIYVAVADEEGSLGGLMEMARPERFLRLLTAAVEAAQWCSLDPVCGQQEGHGPGLLNGAACHACALVPETSCDHGNILLDRTYVKGNCADLRALLDCFPQAR